MDHVLRSYLSIDVLLNCLLFGLEDVRRETSIKQDENELHGWEDAELDNWEDSSDYHGFDDSAADICIPVIIEISVLSSKNIREEGNVSLSHVSVEQKQQDSSVEELSDENSHLDRPCLLRFSVFSNEFN